ncbi:MAG: hypothetical protein QM831_28570 [Kofleriaceae bacterium]
MGLPFLVEHGAWLWGVFLAAVTAGLFGIGYRLRRARTRADYQQEVLPFQGTVTGPVPGNVLLLATVVDDSHLSCDGSDVEVEGTITVRAGTSSTYTRATPSVTYAVHPKDEVFVTGKLRSMPPEHASYREGTPRWILTDAVYYATKPQLRPMPRTWFGMLAGWAFTGLGVFTLMFVVGALLEGDNYEPVDHQDGVLPAFGRHEIAAAMPGSRAKALKRLAYELQEYDRPSSRRGFEELVRVQELRGQCPVPEYRKVADYEGGLVVAKRCGSTDDQIEMLVMLGRFEDAEKLVTPATDSDEAMVVAIANGRWSRAAEIAEHFEAGPHTRMYYAEVPLHQCFGALMRAYAGEPNAFAKVHTPCPIIEASSLPVDQQAAAFAALSFPKDNSGVEGARLELGAPELELAVGPRTDNVFMPTASGSSALMFNIDQSWVYLAPFIAAAHPADQWTDDAENDMAGYETFRGDFAAAHAHLAKLPDDSWQKLDLALGIAIREGTPLPESDYRHSSYDYTGALALRRGKYDQVARDTGRDLPVEDLRRAAEGDGHVLARLLQTKLTYFDTNMHLVMTLLPMIKSGQAEVRDALRFFRSGETMHISRLRPLGDAAAYRDLARLAGDREQQATWQQIVDRWFAMISDRKKIVALLLWG